MRIRHFSPTYFHPDSVMGGGERYVHELARFQARQGATVEVVSCGGRRDFVQDGVSYRIFPARTSGRFTRDNPLSFSALRALVATDIVHVHQVSTLMGDLAVVQACLSRQPIFVTDHGGGGGTVLHRRLPVTAGYASGIGQSHVGVQLLQTKPGLRTVEIPGGVDLDRFTPPAYGAPREGILYVGRLLPHKGVHVLLEACRHFRDCPPVRIVGRVADPAYLQRLRELAQGLPVKFIHDANDVKLVALYRRSAVAVLPSVSAPRVDGLPSFAELMGFTLLEAQACGTPVVASDTGGMGQFIARGVSGEVVRQDDPAALAIGLQKVLADQHAYAARTREWVELFGWEAVAQRHLALYLAALDEGVGQ
ncbi:MAG: glycosyltransferase family 4 protein [Verrucomicrobiota bacterium JB022]|nr:glycosyltransferase family 4 protein [Verrucomicrobiota bacterium JB022]